MATKTATPRTRARKRAIGQDGPEERPDTISPELRKLVIETYRNNIAKNTAERAYEASRAKLLSAIMKRESDKPVVIDTSIDNTKLTLEVVITAQQRSSVDVKALLADPDVTLEKVMDIINMPVGAAEKALGVPLVAKYKTTTTGSENVSVKAKK